MRRWTSAVVEKLTRRVAPVRAYMWVIGQVGRPVLVAAGAGAAAGALAYAAGPWVAAELSAAGGFILALAVQGGLWVRGLLVKLPRPVESRAGAVS